MAFDLQRALSEGLASKTPFLDRLLSYLYFSDMSVLEVASSDAHGRGVSLVGRLGPEGPEDLAVVAPLPRGAAVRGPLEGAEDRHRAASLLAATWAMASLSEDRDDPVRAALIAAHPDTDGASLSGLLRDSNLLHPEQFLLLSGKPVTEEIPVHIDGLGIHLSANVPVQRLSRPLRDIQSWRWMGAMGLAEALDSLLQAQDSGRTLLLCISPAAGLLLEEPGLVEATVGISDLSTAPPDGWEAIDRPSHVKTQGSWAVRIRTLVVAIRRIAETLREAWGGRPPEGSLRIVDIAFRDPAGADLVLWVPPGRGPSVAAALGSLAPGDDCSLSVFHLRSSSPSRSQRSSALSQIPGMVLCLPSGIGATIFGPPALCDDPVEEALDLAGALQSRFHGIFRRRRGRE